MKTLNNLLFFLFLLIMMTSCNDKNKSARITSQGDYPAPPMALIIPDTMLEFGNARIDNYFWMKDRDNPEVMAYLKSENAYTDTVMAHTRDLQEKLFLEMKGRIKEEDQSVPQIDNGYFYYNRTEKDRQYPIYCRKKGNVSSPEEVLFDVNKMAEGTQAYIFSNFEITSDNKLAAYSYNTTGSYAEFNLKIRNLETGEDLPYEISNVQSFVWANDNKTLFYTKSSETFRPYRVYRHQINSKVPDVLLFEEKDEMFNVYVGKSRTKEYIYLASGSFTTSEYRYLPADKPLADFKVFLPRQKDVDYSIQHHKTRIFIKYKDLQHINSMIYEAPLSGFSDKSTWKELVKHDSAVKIQDMDVFDQFLTLYIRKDGLNGIDVIDLTSGERKSISFPEPVYVVSPMYTPEYESLKYRYSYTSLNRPNTVYDYDMTSGASEKLKEQEIPSGFNADEYVVERLWAPTADGKKVPMAVLYKKTLQKDGSNPALLYGYGSYGSNTDAYFRSSLFSLVDRGFVYALAQVRGGSELGEQWYEDGKLMKKMNSFTDFIACGDFLVKEKYTSPSRLGMHGGSAGGLLVGAVANMRPDLFHVVLADVPFVDIINTMQDESLPLTTQEYEQWGNPGEEEAYQYMLSYSPYDNVKPQNYPNILATAGWNDSQVMYHEPAKWVAKLRALKTDNNILLLKTNLESGHGGATGRFDYLKDVAFRYAFLIDRMGVKVAE
ncbi:MAG: S9 family peptidase [Bacteroidales bacterium]|nr:S9 family peptidase [Bacteroidales bacterium]